MTTDQHIPADNGFDQPPFLYEIRVKGRLASQQWTDWFADLTVTSASGESILRGRAADHAALYGLLARLRDLAIPLVAVKVLDEDAQHRLTAQGRRLDLAVTAALVTLYLLMLGGLVVATIFVAPVINTALALTLLFAALAGLAHAFWIWSDRAAWRWVTYVLWPAAAVCFLVFIPLSGLLPTALGIGVMLLLLAGGVVYALVFLRRRSAEIKSWLTWAGLERRRAAKADPTLHSNADHA